MNDAIDDISTLVIISGALGGIGSALVNEYRSCGAKVICLDKNYRATDQEKGKFKVDLHRICQDSDYRAEFKNIIDQQVTAFSKSLILINNAAEQIVKPADKLTLDDWERTFSVNVFAAFYLSKLLFSHLKSLKGHVINVSSVHSKLTKPGFSAYATSKGAIETLTRSLAVEWGVYGIQVNAISPAAVSTPMLLAGFESEPEAYKALQGFHPVGEIGRPEAVARLVKTITSLDSKFLSGAVIDFTGGISSVLHDPSIAEFAR